jgi:hypothetical protein
MVVHLVIGVHEVLGVCLLEYGLNAHECIYHFIEFLLNTLGGFIFVCNHYRLWPTSPCNHAHFKCLRCVQIPSQLWNVFFTFHDCAF